MNIEVGSGSAVRGKSMSFQGVAAYWQPFVTQLEHHVSQPPSVSSVLQFEVITLRQSFRPR